jgi:transaldolase
MTLYLDSASIEDALHAMAWGFVGGITTNPALLGKCAAPPFEVIAGLARLTSGTVFYQLNGESAAERIHEAGTALGIAENIGLKIPCTLDNLAMATDLSRSCVVGMTAVFNAEQAYLAARAGVAFVLPYVNRSKRLRGESPVAAMRRAVEGSQTEIIAASIKSGAEALETLDDGAHHLTLPLAVIQMMAHDDLTVAAITGFASP